jgi:uncharacterized protein (TIGR00290 family)
LPLFGQDPEKILLDFIDSGFEAVIVKTKSDLFGEEWMGQKLNKKFLRYLKENNIGICGENDEYHTLVVDDPIFKKRIKITKSRLVNHLDYRLLDIQECSL